MHLPPHNPPFSSSQATDALLDYLKGSIEELDLYKGVATGDADDKQGGKGEGRAECF